MTASLLALLAWSFAAATLLPLGSEIPFAYIVHTRQEVALPAVVATAGNYLGACTTYWLARGAVRVLDNRRPKIGSTTARQLRAFALVRRWGAPVLAFSWVPVLGDVLVAAAGVLRLSFASCSLWLVAGKLARYLVLAWVALGL
jgi:membrane protein YqaA with SNARE-associated domain